MTMLFWDFMVVENAIFLPFYCPNRDISVIYDILFLGKPLRCSCIQILSRPKKIVSYAVRDLGKNIKG